MAAFHGAYCGVDLTDDADQLFQEGKPWTLAGGQRPNPDDGHCIVKVGADIAVSGADTWVTWGALQKSTPEWATACLREAWVIITAEDAKAASLDIAKLRADIDALHGTGGARHPRPRPSRPPPSWPSSRTRWTPSPPRSARSWPDCRRIRHIGLPGRWRSLIPG